MPVDSRKGRRLVGLSDLDKINFDNAFLAWSYCQNRATKRTTKRTTKRATKRTTKHAAKHAATEYEDLGRFERQCGLAGAALYRLHWTPDMERTYGKRPFDALERYADGLLDYDGLKKAFQGGNVYRMNSDWIFKILCWQGVSESDKLQVVYDVFGAPYEQPRVEDVDRWRDGPVGKVAQLLYDTDGFFELTSLCQALQWEGCRQQELLEHCQRPRHSKGCWLVDLILGKA